MSDMRTTWNEGHLLDYDGLLDIWQPINHGGCYFTTIKRHKILVSLGAEQEPSRHLG